MNRLLRTVRTTMEIGIALLLTAALTCSGPDVNAAAQWLSDMQVIPAALAMSVTVLIFWTGVTLIFGRIYCSTMCPIGALQDTVSRIRQWSRFRHRYHYAPPANRICILWFGIFIGLILAGAHRMALILDPYNAYSAICNDILKSVWVSAMAKTLCASAAGTATATIVLGAVVWTSWKRGRRLCNSVCPAGTALGALSKFSALHMDIDTDLCTQCGRCRDACKAECINLQDHVVDSSRCVVCFNCLTACNDNAIRYTIRRKQLSLPMMQSTTLDASPSSACASCHEATATANASASIHEPEKTNQNETIS